MRLAESGERPIVERSLERHYLNLLALMDVCQHLDESEHMIRPPVPERSGF
jgi:hypothetical protein